MVSVQHYWQHFFKLPENIGTYLYRFNRLHFRKCVFYKSIEKYKLQVAWSTLFQIFCAQKIYIITHTPKNASSYKTVTFPKLLLANLKKWMIKFFFVLQISQSFVNSRQFSMTCTRIVTEAWVLKLSDQIILSASFFMCPILTQGASYTVSKKSFPAFICML